jgi:hypothetical protein
VDADVTLCDQALLVLVDEFDRILDRDHVIRSRAVDEIDERAKSSRLSRACWPGNEDQPFREMAKPLHFLRQSQLFHRYDGDGNRPEYRSRSVSVPQRVPAEAPDARDLVSEIGVVEQAEFLVVLLEH